jgi:hypothetical protein
LSKEVTTGCEEIGAATTVEKPLANASPSHKAQPPKAKAMLEKAVAAVKADNAKAIPSFLAGTDGFKDRDLYPFCFNISDGITPRPRRQ